jgi:hypothetical protein
VKSWLRLAIFAVLLCADVVLAQGDTIVQPDREAERARVSASAADEAALFVPLGDERVSYAEVLARPDDVELSFRYALGQVAEGRLPAAAATLERIMLLRPDFMNVRMLYAVVLYRLGNLAEAEQELLRVSAAPGTSSQQVQIDAYLERIRRERKRSKLSLALNGGIQHDSNRNSGPESNQSLFGGTRLDLAGDARKSGDSGWFSLADLRLERDLGTQEDRQLIAGASYFHSQQEDFSSFDVQALHFELGLRSRRGEGQLHPKLIADVVDLSREKYLRSTGFELTAQRRLTSRIELEGRGRVVHEDFDGIPETATASDRSGYRSDVGAALGIALGASQRLEFLTGITRKSAKESHQAYLGWEVGMSHLWLLPGSSFALSQLSAARDAYHDDQDLISRSRRRDFRSRVRLTLGTPLASWIGADHLSALRGLVVSVNGEVLIADSNLPNYDFRNRRIGVSVSQRFDF